MRIAVTTSAARVVGGAESYLATVIPALRASGYEVAILSEYEGPAGHRQVIDPAQIPNWCVEQLGWAEALRKLAEWKPEIVFAQAALSAQLQGPIGGVAPMVSMVHDYRGACISGSKTHGWPSIRACSRAFGPGCLAYFYPRRCGGLNPRTMFRDYRDQSRRLAELRSSAMVLTASEHMRQEYLKYNLDPDRIRCVGYPVIRRANVSETATAPHAHDGLPFRVLFAGRFEYLKGASILIDAMPLAAAALERGLQLTLAGDGRQRAVLEGQTARIAASEPRLAIMFRGWLDADQMQAEYRSTDLLVVPSLWPEPFGLAGPEAGLHGVPAAAFATGGIPEWLSAGRNGFLASANPASAQGLATAIVKCLSDPERYRLMRMAAVELASRFTVESHLGKLRQIFGEVAGRATLVASKPWARTSG